MDFYATRRYGPNVEAYEKGLVMQQLIDSGGLPTVAKAVQNQYLYDLHKQANLAPTPAQAGEKGARDAQLDWHKYEETKAISPKLQAALETAGNLWSKILAPQVDAALATNSQGIVKNYGHAFAGYLKGADTPDGMRARAMVAASGVVDSVNKFVSASVKESMENKQKKEALAQLIVAGSAQLGLNLGKITGGVIELGLGAEMSKKNLEAVEAALNSSKGFDVATNVMREILTRSFTQINLQNPDQAFAKEHEVVQSLMHGDIQGVAKTLGIDLQGYQKDFDQHKDHIDETLGKIDRSKEGGMIYDPSEATRVKGAEEREKPVKFP